MYLEVSLLVGLSVIASALLTRVVRSLSLKRGLLDVPNARSSHVQPVPRGGGAAFVVVFAAGLVLLRLLGFLAFRDLFLLLPPAIAVALIGGADDRYGLSARVRICVHISASVYVVAFLATIGDPMFAGSALQRVAAGAAVAFLLTWLVNLYNFMDGIDSLAAVEAIYVCVSLAVFTLLGDGSPSMAMACLLLAGAVGGFLLFNWPPARIFMGDIGSGFLGMVLGALALLVTWREGFSPFVPLILLGVFVVDATFTLIRRIIAGERWHEGHRSHSYQRLSRRWGGHLPVVAATAVVNLLWLLPMASWAVLTPQHAEWIALAAYAPLIWMVAAIGAGTSDE